MHVPSCNGKHFRTCSEDVQPNLPSKKLSVLKEDGKINYQMVEVVV